MKNSVHVGAVKVVFLDAFQKIVLVPIIKELQSAEIFVILPIFEVVDNQYIVPPPSIQLLDDIAADSFKTLWKCDRLHTTIEAKSTILDSLDTF